MNAPPAPGQPAAPDSPPDPDQPPGPVVVVGLMGSGKTSVATRLAAALGRPFRDSDPELAAAYGQSAAEQVAQAGMAVLHDREAAHLQEALVDPRAPVIAAAASVVERAPVRAALRPAYVVWLDAPPPVLAARMRTGDHRPHYDPDLERMLTRQRDRRGPWFREVADLVVNTAETTPEEIVDTILTALSRLPNRSTI